MLLAQDRMSCYQNQNNDSISTSSISFHLISSKFARPDLDLKYENLNKTLINLRTKVENITQKLNEDSKENDNKFESFSFIKEF